MATTSTTGSGRAIEVAAGRVVGGSVTVVGETERGESRSTFWATSGEGDLVLKVRPDGPGVRDDQERVVRLVEGLRRRGHPAPEHLGVGVADGVVVTVQRRLRGTPLEPTPGAPPDPATWAAVLPDLLAAVELQADAGDLDDPPWPAWLLDTTAHGGEGFCLHETMRRRPDTSALLDRVLAIVARPRTTPPRRRDIVHVDLNPANALVADDRLVGIVDWNVPTPGGLQGDRGFDLATLLFYAPDDDPSQDVLWDRATAVSGVDWVVVHLAHLVLRQVEWSVRRRPGSEEAARFTRRSAEVLDACELRSDRSGHSGGSM